jgi:hypothetical protein
LQPFSTFHLVQEHYGNFRDFLRFFGALVDFLSSSRKTVIIRIIRIVIRIIPKLSVIQIQLFLVLTNSHSGPHHVYGQLKYAVGYSIENSTHMETKAKGILGKHISVHFLNKCFF